MELTKTYSGTSHTGYTITNEFGAVVAEVVASRRRVPNAGYFIRLYTGENEYSLLHVESLVDARDIATDHAGTI